MALRRALEFWALMFVFLKRNGDRCVGRKLCLEKNLEVILMAEIDSEILEEILQILKEILENLEEILENLEEVLQILEENLEEVLQILEENLEMKISEIDPENTDGIIQRRCWRKECLCFYSVSWFLVLGMLLIFFFSAA
jgi:nucleoside-triphosphatase THEP1